jgi:muramoyltetrapeptide carboxypeptidase
MSRFQPLGPNEPVGVIALSGPVDGDRLGAGLEVLGSWGRPLELASNLGCVSGYLAGSDDERLAGLLEMLDRGVTTLIAARGGYGVTRLLPRLPWRRLIDEGVRLVGFSDLTAVLDPLVAAGGATQIHGPMVAAGLEDPDSAERLLAVLEGRLLGGALFTFAPEQVVREGAVAGPSRGGTLSMLASLSGTPWQPRLDGTVVFLEEVGEPMYRLDRMLTHLRCSATFRGVKALMSGSLWCCEQGGAGTDGWRKLLAEAAPEAVIVTDLPFGHGPVNLAFPLGATVEVDTRAGVIGWRL